MLTFDEQLRTQVLKDFGDEEGRELVGRYQETQRKLERQVYPNIPAAEPGLTDHGIRHIRNVQVNVTRLLSRDGSVTNLSGIEMYCLGMFILFHDAANVLERKDHHRRISTIYDQIHPEKAYRHEKSLVVRAAGAHTGKATDGSSDALKGVDEIDHLSGETVRLRQLAAVLRFADELAEGPQRTSEFMQTMGLISADSAIFHDYASRTHIFIDRGVGRVVVTYEVDVPDVYDQTVRFEELSDFLKFAYRRVLKLDQERRYARHYADLLAPFKATEVTFNFHCGSDLVETGLEPLKLTDLVVPSRVGTDPAAIGTTDPKYEIDALAERVLASCPRDGGDEAGH